MSSIEVSMSESSSMSLVVDRNTPHQKAIESPTHTPGNEKLSSDNMEYRRVPKLNQLSTSDTTVQQVMSNIQAQPLKEATETNNSPSRIGGGIGVTKCPICGKQFGKSSLRFHQLQCEKKQAALQEKRKLAKLEEKRASGYIIYGDFDTGKKQS